MPIGSFQAIKHKFADMMIALERARSTRLLRRAHDRRGRPAPARRRTSMAKAAAGDCQRLLAKEGIQIHGGIGYTWEHDMHLYVKRHQVGRAAVRNERVRIAAELARPRSASELLRSRISANR